MARSRGLSDDALNLLQLHFEGRSLRMGRGGTDSLPGRTVEETRTAYRELVAAGLMYPVSGFASGPESHYRITEEAWHCRSDLRPQVARLSFSAMARRIQPRPPIRGLIATRALRDRWG
jgi:hypothetical protein